jgi:spermidine/putrescine-binding protein
MPAQRPLAEAARRARVELELETVSTNEAIEERIRSSAYDVVCPSDYLVERLRGQGRLMPLDVERLPGRARLASWAEDPLWDPGLTYSTPLAFGTTGILYRRSEVPRPDTWSALFEPPGGRRVGMLSEVREVVGAALMATGHGLNQASPAALAAASALLEAQAPAVRAYCSDDFVSPVEVGDVIAHHAWSGPSSLAVRRDPQLGYSLPREGACLWVTTAAIPVNAPDPDAAHRLIEALLDPELAAATVADEGFATPNDAARAILPPALRDDPVLFPTALELERCQVMRDLGPDEAAIAAVWTGRSANARKF